MIDLGLARTVLAIADAFRGPLPGHLRSLLCDINEAEHLPSGIRRAAAWTLKRDA